MPQYTESNTSENREISLKDFILILKDIIIYLKRRWIIVFSVAFLGGCIGFIYAYMQKPTYTATLTFALEDDKGSSSGISGALGIASTLGFDLGSGAGGAFSGANLIELMQSRRLIEKSLLNEVSFNGTRMTLAEMYIQLAGWRKEWEKDPAVNAKVQFKSGTDRSQFTLAQDSVLGMIYGRIAKYNLNVGQKDKKISIINIDVKSENELFSKYFAEILAKEVSDFYIDTKSKKAKLNVAILERQTDSIRGELNKAITGVAAANDITYNLNPAFNIERAPSSKRQIDVQANTAILTQLVANLEMARVSLRKETPLIQVIDVPVLPLEKEKKSKLMTAIAFAFVFGLIVCLFFTIRMFLQPILKNKKI